MTTSVVTKVVTKVANDWQSVPFVEMGGLCNTPPQYSEMPYGTL